MVSPNSTAQGYKSRVYQSGAGIIEELLISCSQVTLIWPHDADAMSPRIRPGKSQPLKGNCAGRGPLNRAQLVYNLAKDWIYGGHTCL